MEFMELEINDVLVVRGAILGMSLDHNGDTFYILGIVGGDHNGDEQMVTFAIPPSVTKDFIRVVNGMDPKRE